MSTVQYSTYRTVRYCVVVEFEEMVYSSYTLQRILEFHSYGLSVCEITKAVTAEGLTVSKTGVLKFLRKYVTTGSIGRRPGSGRPFKVTQEMLAIVEEQMQRDDETSAVQLQTLLVQRGCALLLRTILRSRALLGWTFRGSAYCQLIRDANKQKRLRWAQDNLRAALHDCFQDVVWTDETTVQLECHRRYACHKVGQPPRLKPRYVRILYVLHVPNR